MNTLVEKLKKKVDSLDAMTLTPEMEVKGPPRPPSQLPKDDIPTGIKPTESRASAFGYQREIHLRQVFSITDIARLPIQLGPPPPPSFRDENHACQEMIGTLTIIQLLNLKMYQSKADHTVMNLCRLCLQAERAIFQKQARPKGTG